MKFAGLILICASSCLALILPAFGVVQFPKVTRASLMPGTTAMPNSINRTDGLMISTNPSAWTPYNPNTAENVILPNNIPPSLPKLGLEATATGTEASNRSGWDVKLGMGIWLLLGPVCLIGLALWTFGPMPSGSGSRTK